ncbi:hypothetical protein BC826DRAFT_214588 [Russula brevipes]|nr:hypothetical protein BC826DRAFT_214588 [Russula brevipes]
MVCEKSSLLMHLNRHIDKEMACIYDDCDERFSRIKDLAEHEKNEHADDEPPPLAIPRPPELKSLVALPQTVPSYTTTTRPASKPSITAERHARLGPWTLGMIIGHASVGPDTNWHHTALRPRYSTRLTDKALDIAPTPTFSIGDSGEKTDILGRSAEYDLIEDPSAASTRAFGDLDGVEVTREFYDGCESDDISEDDVAVLPMATRSEAEGTESEEASAGAGGGASASADADSLAVEALL